MLNDDKIHLYATRKVQEFEKFCFDGDGNKTNYGQPTTRTDYLLTVSRVCDSYLELTVPLFFIPYDNQDSFIQILENLYAGDIEEWKVPSEYNCDSTTSLYLFFDSIDYIIEINDLTRPYSNPGHRRNITLNSSEFELFIKKVKMYRENIVKLYAADKKEEG